MNALTKINELESIMLGLPQVACDATHAFGGGIYIRQVRMLKGSLVMGHRHKTEHLNIMLTGRMTLFHDNGTRDELVAPVIVVAKPGRKVAFIHEDVIWLNLFPTTETDVDKLESEYLDKTGLSEALNNAFNFDHSEDHRDFEDFLWQFGLTAEYVRKESENTLDQIPFPTGSYRCKVGKSHIEGRGLIATGDIHCGECIAPARLDGKRTPAGRYTNHSKTPNARMVAVGGDLYLMALRNIGGCLGGQDGEEITVDYRDALGTNLRITQ